MKRYFIIGLAVTALLTTSCGHDESAIGAPDCSDEMILVAQSVPDAAFVPCFEELPGGWSVNDMSIGHAGTSVNLDSDRAGENAAKFDYDDGCDVTGIGRVPSELDGVAIHQEIDQVAGGLKSTRYYVFEGGCVTVRLDFDEFDDATYAEGLLDSMQLLSRDDINAAISQENDLFEI
jgi:hypothetical protein